MRKIVFLAIFACSFLSAFAQIDLIEQTISDSLALVREKEILSEYGLRYCYPCGSSRKLQIKDIASWKKYLVWNLITKNWIR